ncbi:MutS-related protein [Flavicella marina]|uniref:MutS-related protein n=1 Tax=Flavicella marina TaxID=1475951 RepID=UPI001D01AD35|nr:DNA mismatch repair protein MutS [Flavicella marina]
MQKIQFYKKQQGVYNTKADTAKKQLIRLSWMRFLSFVVTVFFIYYFLGQSELMFFSVLLGGSIFSFFLKKYWKKKEEKLHLDALKNINQLELSVLKGDVSQLKSGDNYKNAQHEYSFDVDLFGKGSFFQILNRTVTEAGEKKLVELLESNDILAVQNKQTAVKELAEAIEWRQEFSALASSIKPEISIEAIVKWLKGHKSNIPKIMRWVPIDFSILSFLLLVGLVFSFVSVGLVTLWFFIGLTISGVYLKQVNELYTKAGKAKHTFEQYYKLLSVVEASSFQADLLQIQLRKIHTSSESASRTMRSFFQYLNALDQRNNIFFAIFGNAFLLWDVKQAYKIESWLKLHESDVQEWFDVISFFDAYNSLANYTFNYPKFSFPEIMESDTVFKAVGLGHPLLSEAKRITSDCKMIQTDFFIITGANMAGKSTFLRSVSLAIVMSNLGLPVCATRFEYTPIKLITSIRNSDSLNDETSYFFSELKRLKHIVSVLNIDNYFIVLDEILKGTNSIDKAEGSQKFVEKLVASNATGIIATHDLSLCEIEKQHHQIQNYYFDAEIKNDELYFDYTLKSGVCQNMNASFLLKKMEIV